MVNPFVYCVTVGAGSTENRQTKRLLAPSLMSPLYLVHSRLLRVKSRVLRIKPRRVDAVMLMLCKTCLDGQSVVFTPNWIWLLKRSANAVVSTLSSRESRAMSPVAVSLVFLTILLISVAACKP